MPRRKIWAILVGLLAFQLLFFPFEQKTFGFINIPHFGTIGFLLTIVVGHCVNFLAFKTPKERKKYIYGAATISLVAAFASIFRASFTDRFLLISLSSFWWLISFYLFIIPNEIFGSYIEVLAIPFRLVNPAFAASVKFLSIITNISFAGSRVNKLISKVVLGLLITIPTAGALILLLSSADPIFLTYVRNIFNIDLTLVEVLVQILWRIFFSLFVFAFLGVLVLMKISSRFNSPTSVLQKENSHLIGPYLMLTTTLSVTLIFFLAIQVKYLAIRDLGDLTSFGITTFSEYVRKGFAELILATGIVYGVSAVGLLLYRSFKPHRIHLFLNSLLIILNLALAAMAYRRVYLYMQEHGLTHMRVYGIMVLLILVFFLITMFLRYFIKNHKLYLTELLGASLIVFLFSMANVDYLLARVAPPTVNKEVDFNYLARLSADDPDSWIAVYEYIKKDTLPLLDKENLSLDEMILILRSTWAAGEIYDAVGTLVHKYGTEGEKQVFDEEYWDFHTAKGILLLNLKEYSSYLALKNKIDLVQLKEMRDKLYSKSMPIDNTIPGDVYQFTGNW